VLRHGNIELVESTFTIKFIPKNMKERLLFVGRIIIGGFQIEDTGIDGSPLQPVRN
jgi:hypothetical protein